MAYEDLLNHTCDIYHVIKTPSSPGYGLAQSDEFSYSSTPDITDVPCHFSRERSSSVSMEQREPQTEYILRVKIGFPIGTDVRLNDRIVHKQTGLDYRAEIPDNVRGHHINVYGQRKGKQALI